MRKAADQATATPATAPIPGYREQSANATPPAIPKPSDDCPSGQADLIEISTSSAANPTCSRCVRAVGCQVEKQEGRRSASRNPEIMGKPSCREDVD